ncbi:hypothetical protein MTO96_001994 [Rhipicephalus appendiculatus]
MGAGGPHSRGVMAPCVCVLDRMRWDVERPGSKKQALVAEAARPFLPPQPPLPGFVSILLAWVHVTEPSADSSTVAEAERVA